MATPAEIQEALDHLDPAALDYQEWINVGMAIKSEGLDCSVWDAWSSRDSARYHAKGIGSCASKWKSFKSSGITASTIFGYAKEKHGWTTGGDDEILPWDAEINEEAPPVTVEKVSIPHIFRQESGAEQLRIYLSKLFDMSDLVSYAPNAFQNDDGKWLPSSQQNTGRLVADMVKALSKTDDINSVVGDPCKGAGMWIRFNPVSGKTNEDGNVDDNSITAYKYALVESDNMSLDDQYSVMLALKLPIAALVASGGKSLHAIVKVDAENETEYRERVQTLFEVCNKNGLSVDKQNKNPSRLSRMPGVMRGDRMQELLATNLGASSWAEWMTYIDDPHDILPPILDWYTIKDDLPPLQEELIAGVLRKGHKMMVSAASKAGKSFLMIELAVRLAEGLDWMDCECRKSRVLYCNFEIADASFNHRVKDIYNALGLETKSHNLQIWNLRGQSQSMDKFSDSLIRRVLRDGHYDVVIIDPIYKVQRGQENDAKDVSDFCNALDRICQLTGVSAIYVHHHSKGDKTGVKAIDRASGSGVFGRDADSLVDLPEVELPAAERDRYPGAEDN